MFNGAKSSKHKGASVKSRQSESEPRVIYCGQKEVRTSKWILFFDGLGQGQGIFFHAFLLLTMYVNSHRHIYCFSHPISKCTHSYTYIVSHWTLQGTQKMLLSSSLKNFWFKITFTLWAFLKMCKNHPLFQWWI